jgi:hypothetical protein
MSFPAFEVKGVLLSQEETGENFLRISIFSEVGLQRCLLRKANKKKLFSPPDLFDDVEVMLKAASVRGLPFVQEYVVHSKRRQLGTNFEKFEAAGILSRFYLSNGEHLLDCSVFYKILRSALSALIDEMDPSAVLFKALFIFASKEGLPVKEAWLQSQTETMRKQVIELVERPLAKSPHLAIYSSEWLSSLKNWLRAESELIC